jgi:short-subunit dehydrogenase
MAAPIHPPLMAAYSAAKAGVVAMADSLRIELHGTRVAVGVAYFGFVNTDMTREGLDHPLARSIIEGGRGWMEPRPLPVEAAALGPRLSSTR